MLRGHLYLVSALLVGGCAFGNTIDYQKQSLQLSAKTEKSVAVAVDDKRSYVVNGDYSPEWVGLVRSGFGIPYGLHTTSGKPLAVDFATAIVSAMQANGIKASAVTLPVSASTTDPLEALSSAKAERTLLVEIDQWKTDKYFRAELQYALKAEVRDDGGSLLGSSSARNVEKSVGGSWTIAAEKASIGKAEDALKMLLDDAKIVDALK